VFCFDRFLGARLHEMSQVKTKAMVGGHTALYQSTAHSVVGLTGQRLDVISIYGCVALGERCGKVSCSIT